MPSSNACGVTTASSTDVLKTPGIERRDVARRFRNDEERQDEVPRADDGLAHQAAQRLRCRRGRWIGNDDMAILQHRHDEVSVGLA